MDEILKAKIDELVRNGSPEAISETYYSYFANKRRQISLDKRQRSRVAAADTAVATQFFTPTWLASYLVDGAVGDRVCTVFDPAVGTGNLLLCAYDRLLKNLSAKGEGHCEEKAAELLYGVDIDENAVYAAKSALESRCGNTLFHIYCIRKPSEELVRKSKGRLTKILKLLFEKPWLGSIIRPDFDERDIDELKEKVTDPYDLETLDGLSLLKGRYDALIENPPYLASSDYDESLKEYVFLHYPTVKQDLFAVFILRSTEMMNEDGKLSVLCPYNWMFIKSFLPLRRYLLTNFTIEKLIQLSTGGYKDAVVYLSAFVLSKSGGLGEYVKLSGFSGSEQDKMLAIANESCGYSYRVDQNKFLSLPTMAICFWVSDAFFVAFSKRKLSDYLDIRQGLATGDNSRFVKKISDVDAEEIDYFAESIDDFDRRGKKYAPYNKGGKYRKWYGNRQYCILFDGEARSILSKQGNRLPSKEYYFKECITWTLVSSKGYFGARYSNHSVFDVGGSCGFIPPTHPDKPAVSLYVILAYLCSNVANYFLQALNPTLNMQVGDLKNLPFIVPKKSLCDEVERLTKESIAIAEADWYNGSGREAKIRMKIIEERLNEIFIETYGLSFEVSKDVPERLITLNGGKE